MQTRQTWLERAAEIALEALEKVELECRACGETDELRQAKAEIQRRLTGIYAAIQAEQAGPTTRNRRTSRTRSARTRPAAVTVSGTQSEADAEAQLFLRLWLSPYLAQSTWEDAQGATWADFGL